MSKNDKERIEELERRIKELEARPVYVLPYPVPQPYPVYPTYPVSPTVDPWPWYRPTITCEVKP